MLRRHGRRSALALTLAVGLLASVGIASADAAGGCARPHEQRALQARVLQTELMVAALQCQSTEDYNAFITRFRAELQEQSESLRGMFVRQYGGGANQQLNALVTRLANQASQRSMAGRIGFCQNAKLLFAEAQAADTSAFDALAAKAAEAAFDYGVDSCGDSAPIVGYGTASSEQPAAR